MLLRINQERSFEYQTIYLRSLNFLIRVSSHRRREFWPLRQTTAANGWTEFLLKKSRIGGWRIGDNALLSSTPYPQCQDGRYR
jgi:hypothetical protein